MRLIDADALKEEIRKRIRHLRNYEGAAICLKALNDAPTIDAAPDILRAEWILSRNDLGMADVRFAECSNCEEVSSPVYRYCPHCGARMDGVDRRNQTDH